MFLYKNLYNEIFTNHMKYDTDNMIIISGYVGPTPIKELSAIPITTKIVCGMYMNEKLSRSLFMSLKNFDNERRSVLYSKIPVHSKCYIWLKKDKIVSALVGSANFTTNGLKTDFRESLVTVNQNAFSELNKYIDFIFANSLKTSEITESMLTEKKSNEILRVSGDEKTCILSLLDENGEVPEKSGLNWGLAKLSGSHVSLGDAYIAIPSEAIQKYPFMFFPKQGFSKDDNAKVTRQSDSVDFIWDDGTSMEGLLEGTFSLGGIDYPKQMASSGRKNILGKYIRERLGVSLEYKITRKDLENYGRTNIAISLIGDGVFSLDFSVNKK